MRSEVDAKANHIIGRFPLKNLRGFSLKLDIHEHSAPLHLERLAPHRSNFQPIHLADLELFNHGQMEKWIPERSSPLHICAPDQQQDMLIAPGPQIKGNSSGDRSQTCALSSP
ncbi:hypothetical protein AVEN_28315-1 [Araneus ventricosus]|uniref:Uncharacterized protein n=1 Tax=Araneus ventricosus TaxID=182803 RepID=A0A4Y2DHS1_ARAVE|nr:hypothetical protein AVEN_28315-1 [Araneus ventricosus]